VVVDVLDVGIVSLHWRLRVLAWGRQCAAAVRGGVVGVWPTGLSVGGCCRVALLRLSC